MKMLQLVGVVLTTMLVLASPALAADAPTAVLAGAGAGAGLVIIGAGYGFGRIGGSALEGMARQPEVAAQIQTAMIIVAALLEGATFFALIICYMKYTA
jgi:F-type H+-transporting ATPase subunit c